MDETSPAQVYEEIGRSLHEFCDSCWRERDGDVVAHSKQQKQSWQSLIGIGLADVKSGSMPRQHEV